MVDVRVTLNLFGSFWEFVSGLYIYIYVNIVYIHIYIYIYIWNAGSEFGKLLMILALDLTPGFAGPDTVEESRTSAWPVMAGGTHSTHSSL